MVQIKRENRRKVYEYLLNEGVIVVKKDFMLPVHAETKVKNLEVWMLLRSMKDKDLVELVFSWQYYYYYLKNEGVKYLRDKLGHLILIFISLFRHLRRSYTLNL